MVEERGVKWDGFFFSLFFLNATLKGRRTKRREPEREGVD